MKSNKINGLRVLQSELLLATGVKHGWFDSSLGNVISRPDNPFDDPEWIDESTMRQRWAKACEALGLDDSRLIITTGLLQTDKVQTVDAANVGKRAGPADGYVTNTPELPILLAAGDCIQAVVYAPDVHAMTVAHAGGLGTSRGLLAKTVKRLIADFQANPQRLIVAIGPSVSPEHFVPTRAADDFTLADIADSHPVTKKLPDGRVGYDIVATNIQQLRELGVPGAQIEVSNIDTFTNHNWYSYERDKTQNPPAAMRRHGLLVALPQKES